MRPAIVSRYIAREVLTVWVAVIVVLFLVLLTNRFVRYLGQAAEGDVPGQMILQLLGYEALSQLGMTIPASFFLATVLALGRFYRDSEMAAMAACGIGPGRQLRAVFLVAVPLTLAVAGVTLFVAPWAERASDELMAQAESLLLVQGVQAGRFFQPKGIDGMVYVENVAGDGHTMEGVFLKGRRDGETVLLRAERATRTQDPETGARYLVLHEGSRYEGVPGAGQWRKLRFREHGIRIEAPPAREPDADRGGLRTAALLASDRAFLRSELQWRVSLPLMLLVLSFVAVPLSRSGPRDVRYTSMFVAVLIYLLYSNGLAAGEEWVKQGTVPLWLGLWWIHGVALAVGAIWLVRQFGWPGR
ncbi:LPS export ABC transporter permease LptF [Ectothiorhodospiraceae bacterium WFHF3C12]|nr:LPS export ABC transporter permease LptF [Ectothiorhodospiraceae bacterium WFHF3C12]